MIVALSMHNQTIEELVEQMGFPKLIDLLDKVNNQKVEIFLPKMKLNVENNLKNILEKMNLTAPFSSTADFGGIADGNLFVSEAKHDAALDVNEEGTEANAVTKLVISSKTNPKLFLANRPFAFLIRDKQYNIPLFCGVVNKL
ncbi:hypothetical protein B4U80_00732 [Leptotrombidium deliense]|uniref:Serpin domain-containing protein n=1 Tax=Leptotrombidium deliense TaxID=299467 RepID=A0A443S666_9ACAR|nr:hypothetical protein B4U80_00732 [Leptotrombidium deliense]